MSNFLEYFIFLLYFCQVSVSGKNAFGFFCDDRVESRKLGTSQESLKSEQNGCPLYCDLFTGNVGKYWVK
jgi:hypothetical protein